MNKQKYNELIDKELSLLPNYVKEFYLNKNLALTTKYQYLTEIRRFFTWLRESGISNAKDNRNISLELLEKLSRSDVMLYLDYLKNIINKQKQSNAPTTINRSINALRSLYHYLTVISDAKDGEPYFYRNVMSKIESLNSSKTLNLRAHEIEAKMLTGQDKHNFLDYLENNYESEISKRQAIYFKKNKERDIAIFALMLGSGIRVSEAANTNVKDLDLKTETLDVTRKGGQKDNVPIAHWTIPYIKEYLDIRSRKYKPDKTEQALFLTRYGGAKRILSNTIERFVSKYSKKYGKRLTPHKLRHTLASELYEQTKDEVLVAQQLGQKGTSATALYTHVGDSKQKDALNKIK